MVLTAGSASSGSGGGGSNDGQRSGGGSPGVTGALLTMLPVSDLKAPGKGGAWNLTGKVNWKNASVVNFQGEQVVRVPFGRGSGSGGRGEGGVAINAAPRPLPANSAILACDIYFEKGWNFSNGGKLGPGIGIGYGGASGGDHSPTGASCRVSFERGGAAHAYLYPPSGVPQVVKGMHDTGYGSVFLQDVFTPGTLKVGQWNHVELGVKLNSFDSKGNPNPDGMALLHINGKTAYVRQIRWTRSSNLNIRTLSINPFFGGETPSAVDCTAYYKNFKLLSWT